MTTKTLKELFEVYRPAPKDEQDFVDKHVTIKHKDRNGNGDDVFKGNTKTIKRKGERHGYDAGDDEKVYEEVHGMWKVDFPKQHAGKAVAAGSVHVKAQNSVHAHKVAAKRVGVDPKMFKSNITKSSILPEEVEDLDEAGLVVPRRDNLTSLKQHSFSGNKLKGNQHKIDTNKNGRIDAHDFHLLRKKKMQEELSLDDLLEEGKVGFKHYTLTSYPREFRTGEGGDITHVAAHPKKMSNLDVEHNKSDKYGDTRHVTVRNNETGEETEHHVYQSSGADSKGKPTVSIRTIGKSKSQQAKHANVIAHYIAGKTKIKESVDDSVMSENAEINALLDEALELLNSLDESTFTEEELALRDELTELSVKKLLNYTAAASSAKNAMKTSTAKLDNRYKGVMRAGDKINKGFSKVHATEEVEDLDEAMNDEDDGWYTHNELHGKVSRQDWKKGWRYNKSKAKPYFNSNSKTWHSAIKEEVEDLDEATFDPAKASGAKLRDYSFADDIQKNKDGTHTFRSGFFYTHGRTSEKHANSISSDLHKLGIKHDIVDHGTQDHKAFRGGASVRSQNHHWATIKIHPGQKVNLDESIKINELSTDTLNRYQSKASNAAAVAGMNADNAGSSRKAAAYDNEYRKRESGIDAADRALARKKKMTKEEVESIDEATGVKVTKHNYDFGRMITVHDGIHQSFPLHPEHQAKIRAMSKGDKTSFKDETGKTIHAERTGSLVHLKQHGENRTASVGYHHFQEEVEGLDETAYERSLEDHHPRKVQGVFGMKSKPFEKKFKNQAAQDKFFDHPDREGNYELHYVSKINEEVEDLDELSSKTIGSYVSKAANSLDNNSFIGGMHGNTPRGDKADKTAEKRRIGLQYVSKKLTKEDIINRAIENYLPADYVAPTLEEQLIDRIEHLPESCALTLFELFQSLNEANQITMISNIETQTGINSMLDFAINNRGA